MDFAFFGPDRPPCHSMKEAKKQKIPSTRKQVPMSQNKKRIMVPPPVQTGRGYKVNKVSAAQSASLDPVAQPITLPSSHSVRQGPRLLGFAGAMVCGMGAPSIRHVAPALGAWRARLRITVILSCKAMLRRCPTAEALWRKYQYRVHGCAHMS
ncbi:hypothetical protein ACFW1F_31835 [Streptomyces bungoensis]|uniref:hypothetical protein n=2 Tax=Streptomyces bungoensis TaxID=285568 RepID=UPI0036B78F06